MKKQECEECSKSQFPKKTVQVGETNIINQGKSWTKISKFSCVACEAIWEFTEDGGLGGKDKHRKKIL